VTRWVIIVNLLKDKISSEINLLVFGIKINLKKYEKKTENIASNIALSVKTLKKILNFSNEIIQKLKSKLGIEKKLLTKPKLH